MPFPFYHPVLIRELPLPSIPFELGQGPTLPMVITVNTVGVTSLASLGIPDGADLTITLTGGGGGGAKRDNSGAVGPGGGGGGAGTVFVLPFIQWSPSGTVTVADGAEGGSGVHIDGGPGEDSMCEWSDGSVVCGGGAGGVGIGGAGGAGGVTEFTGSGHTVVTARNGYHGSPGTNGVAGAGAPAGIGSKGTGGRGNYTGDGMPGNLGQAVIQFTLPPS